MTKSLKQIFATFLILIISFSGLIQANEVSDNLTAKNAKHYTEKFIVGGQPSQNDLIILSKSGIKTVINLRGEDEFNDFDEKSKVEALGMSYISLPIAGASGINKKNLALFSKAIEKPEQAFVHCASGNRVGAMFALDAYFNKDENLEDAITIGKKSGLTRLETKVRRVITEK